MSAVPIRNGTSTSSGRTPPPQPDYNDEVTKEHLDAIAKLVDPDGKRAQSRVLLHIPAW